MDWSLAKLKTFGMAQNCFYVEELLDWPHYTEAGVPVLLYRGEATVLSTKATPMVGII